MESILRNPAICCVVDTNIIVSVTFDVLALSLLNRKSVFACRGLRIRKSYFCYKKNSYVILRGIAEPIVYVLL